MQERIFEPGAQQRFVQFAGLPDCGQDFGAVQVRGASEAFPFPNEPRRLQSLIDFKEEVLCVPTFGARHGRGESACDCRVPKIGLRLLVTASPLLL